MMGLFRCKEKGHVNEGYICVKYNWRRWMLWDVEHWHCKLYLALHRTIGTRCYSVPHPSRNDCHPSKEAGMIPAAMETIHKESKKSFMDHHDRLLEVKHPFLSIFDDNVVSATPSESGDQQPAAQDGEQQTSAVEQQQENEEGGDQPDDVQAYELELQRRYKGRKMRVASHINPDGMFSYFDEEEQVNQEDVDEVERGEVEDQGNDEYFSHLKQLRSISITSNSRKHSHVRIF